MKKLLLYGLCILLFITGCDDHEFQFSNYDFTQVFYNDISLIEDDYSKLKKLFSGITFSETKKETSGNHVLTFYTKEDRYIFTITDDFNMYYEKDDKKYVAKDTTVVKSLYLYLESRISAYKNQDFYTITHLQDYLKDDKDMLIKIDNGNDYFVFKSNEKIYNFKIHKLEYDKNKKEYYEVDMPFQKSEINGGQVVVIRGDFQKENSKIRISFESSYRFVVTITPKYQKDGKGMAFEKTFEPKQNP